MKTLIPVITQDVRTNDVLMMAWMDEKALAKTKKTGWMHYWSRSRNKYWKKGEESGHVQKLVSLHYDCDKDTILARVEQTGPACHTGSATCWTKNPWRVHPAIDELHQELVFDKPLPFPKAPVGKLSMGVGGINACVISRPWDDDDTR